MSKAFNCKYIAKDLKDNIRLRVENFLEKGYKAPHLAVIQVGDDYASSKYVANKKKAGVECGIEVYDFHFGSEITEEMLITFIKLISSIKDIHGVMVQLPLPSHINTQKVLQAIPSEKDVDGFTYEQQGRLAIGDNDLVPCTPKGVMHILYQMGVELTGKKVVVVGRSNIVGKPLATLLTQRNATVTLCHSHTEGLKTHLEDADIVVMAVGKAGMLNSSYKLKEGVILIDVGINRDEDGGLCGDIHISDELLENVKYYTPVPGGVGVMTVAMLMHNTYLAYINQVTCNE